MKKSWFVIDANELYLSYSDKKEKSESFATKTAALKRARDLAKSEPDVPFLICEAVSYAIARSSPVTVEALQIK